MITVFALLRLFVQYLLQPIPVCLTFCSLLRFISLDANMSGLVSCRLCLLKGS